MTIFSLSVGTRDPDPRDPELIIAGDPQNRLEVLDKINNHKNK
jgi:hypothetical protein